jgi:hypothetical protein
MSALPPSVLALVEAGRQAGILDPQGGARLAAALAAAGGSLAEALDACSVVPVAVRHRLGRLLAPAGRRLSGWSLVARLPAMHGEQWLGHDAVGTLACIRVEAAAGDDLVAAELARRRFRREAEACRTLSHPHLVRFLDGGVGAAGEAWFALEHVTGGDLALTLRLAGGRLDEAAVVAIGVQISAGLGELARRGLVHRAVAPGTIVIAGDGAAKLGGFGLLRSGGSAATRMDVGGGLEVAYTAPELHAGGLAAPVADVYALGCVLMQCLAGRPPFLGDPLSVMHGHAAEAPPDVRLLAQGVTEATADAVMACLIKDPARRCSAEQVHQALSVARAGLRTAMARVSDRMPVVQRPGVSRVKRSLALAGQLADMPVGDVLLTMQRMQADGLLELAGPGPGVAMACVSGALVGLVLTDANAVAGLAARLADHDPALADRIAGTAPGDAVALCRADTSIPAEVLRQALEGILADAVNAACQPGAAGTFEFTALSADDPRLAGPAGQGLQVVVAHLLAEGARQAEDLPRLEARLPAPWAMILVPALDRLAVLGEFRRYPERAVIGALDGTATRAQVAGAVRATAYAAARICADLQERGLLSVLDVPSCLALGAAGVGAALAQQPGDPAIAALMARQVAEADPAVAVPGWAASAWDADVTPPPGPVAGDPATALAGDWLALVAQPDGTGTAVHLHAVDELILGKLAKDPVHVPLRLYPEADHLEASNRISRIHLRIAWTPTGEGWTVRDEGSSNGTVVDGKRLAPAVAAPVAGGSVLAIADVITCDLHAVGGDGLPPGPGPRPPMAGLVLRRRRNRPELVVAMVRGRIGLGGPGADVVVPGAPPGPVVAVCRHGGAWWWTTATGGEPWRPVAAGTILACGPVRLTARLGAHALCH